MRRVFQFGVGSTGALVLACALGGLGCNKAEAAQPAPAPSASVSAAKADPHAKNDGHGKTKKSDAKTKAAADEPSDRRFMVPFSWEAKKDDPLARTRAFLKDAFEDNAGYVKSRGPAFFEGLKEAEHPRATLLGCSDSRVHTNAFDQTPEDDVFTIRNIGNQLSTAEGSVEYGIKHLKTSVLVVLGHTRCSSVKAAMGDLSGESSAFARELQTIRVPKAKEPKKDAKDGKGKEGPDVAAWLAAVKVNVNNQVASALSEFGDEIEQGNLTVVGAVYDLADDMQGGAGVVHVINVNGNTDVARISAFSRAVRGLPALDESEGRDEKAAGGRSGHAARTARNGSDAPHDLSAKLAALRSLKVPPAETHAAAAHAAHDDGHAAAHKAEPAHH